MTEEQDPYIGRPAVLPPKPKSEPKAATDKPKRRRRRPLSQAELFKKCRSAVHVYLALRRMAGEGRQVFPTRERIAAATGIRRMNTISEALTALEEARWISRKLTTVHDDGWNTLLTITLSV